MWRFFKKLVDKIIYKRPKKTPPPTPVKVPGDEAIIIDGVITDLKIHEINGFTQDQKDFFIKVANLFIQVQNSKEFKRAFLNRSYREDYGLPRLKLYNITMSGLDAVHNVADFVLDTIYTLYDGNTKTIGYTRVGKLGIFTNRYFVKKWMREPFGMAKWAGHLAHELAHNMGENGFYHKVTHRDTFVYEYGYLIRDTAIEYLKGEIELNPLKEKPLA